jgi:hypothetical protein
MPAPNWHPLVELREQLKLNLEALEGRDAELTARLRAIDAPDCFISGDVNRIILGRARVGAPAGEPASAGGSKTQIHPLPNPVSPAHAHQIASKLFPELKCSDPTLVAGLDHGWLWQKLYDLETHCPRTPGHRPPLYFLARELERLWAVLHFHDWAKLLADPRVRLFAGADAVEQATRSLAQNPLVPWPKFSVTVDPTIWPAGSGIDCMLRDAHESVSPRMNQLTRQLNALDATIDPLQLASRFSGGTLRVLGITSRFTTFLQYSMRDWLAAFESLGHETLLLIEQADHELVNPLEFASISADFRPDLILMIDHYRGEFTGLPQRVPCVMWVQDRLPNIYRAQAGAAQKEMDFVIGYGRQECALSHGYPAERFMPAMVGFNEKRFARRELGASEIEQFTCDVSFVSHASTPPEVLVQNEIQKTNSPEAANFLRDMFDRLRAIYDAGSFVTEAGHVQRIIREAMRENGIETSSFGALSDFVLQRVNNALFRQQAVGWLADMDVRLHLYGRGWENHPRFRQSARGVADNERQLSAIYQASAINMQITPFGAVHQRLCDGLAAGGFFLLRHCTGDTCDRIYQDLWNWVEQNDIRTGQQLFKQAPPQVRAMLDEIIRLTGDDIDAIPDRFFFGLDELAACGFARSASTLWNDEYERVSFSTQCELEARVKHFLSHADERREIADSMRQRALECMSYRGITSRMLRFIAENLARSRVVQAAA